jgi:hypothetical protein
VTDVTTGFEIKENFHPKSQVLALPEGPDFQSVLVEKRGKHERSRKRFGGHRQTLLDRTAFANRFEEFSNS